MNEKQKIKLLKENKDLQFDDGKFFCNTQTTKHPNIKCGESHNGDKYFCKRCFNINYPETLHSCVECKEEFKTTEDTHWETAYCKECDVLEKEGEQ